MTCEFLRMKNECMSYLVIYFSVIDYLHRVSGDAQ